eukprot:1190810-Prorocentrum_minimum.AAC.1
MGASQSSECEGDVTSGFPRRDGPSSPDSDYIAGTNLPVDGWLQPCTSCATTTARTVIDESSHCIYMCRRCSHAAGLMGGLDERRWEVAADSPSSLEETKPSGGSLDDAIACEEDVNAIILVTTDDDDDSHTRYSVDVLCSTVVGEMLIYSPPVSPRHHVEVKRTGNETPTGVVEGADAWSELDNSSDGDSSGNSPKVAARRAFQNAIGMFQNVVFGENIGKTCWRHGSTRKLALYASVHVEWAAPGSGREGDRLDAWTGGEGQNTKPGGGRQGRETGPRDTVRLAWQRRSSEEAGKVPATSCGGPEEEGARATVPERIDKVMKELRSGGIECVGQLSKIKHMKRKELQRELVWVSAKHAVNIIANISKIARHRGDRGKWLGSEHRRRTQRPRGSGWDRVDPH